MDKLKWDPTIDIMHLKTTNKKRARPPVPPAQRISFGGVAPKPAVVKDDADKARREHREEAMRSQKIALQKDAREEKKRIEALRAVNEVATRELQYLQTLKLDAQQEQWQQQWARHMLNDPSVRDMAQARESAEQEIAQLRQRLVGAPPYPGAVTPHTDHLFKTHCKDLGVRYDFENRMHVCPTFEVLHRVAGALRDAPVNEWYPQGGRLHVWHLARTPCTDFSANVVAFYVQKLHEFRERARTTSAPSQADAQGSVVDEAARRKLSVPSDPADLARLAQHGLDEDTVHLLNWICETTGRHSLGPRVGLSAAQRIDRGLRFNILDAKRILGAVQRGEHRDLHNDQNRARFLKAIFGS